MTRFVVPLLVLAALAQASCGGSGGSSRPTGDGSPPKRVVAMSWTDADYALELGVVPVGIAKVATSEDGLEPWQRPLLGDARPKLFDTTSGDPIEAVAALKPDLIIATKDYDLKQSKDKLEAIAPVVAYTSAPNDGEWERDAVRVGKALGREAQARRYVAKVEAQVAAARKAHPGLDGKTFSLAIQPQGGSVFTVNSAQDVSVQFLRRLGLQLAPGVRGLPTSSIPGRAQVSFERLDALRADVLLATGTPDGVDELRASKLYQSLERAGGFRYLPPATAQAMAFPSPLSISWAVRQLVPELAAAAA